jgi:hypothetical protein
MTMAKAAEKTTTYDVKKRIMHDGKPLTQGDTIDLTDSAAAPLLQLGAISLPAAPAATK